MEDPDRLNRRFSAMEQLPEIIFIDGVLHTLYTTPLLPWLREQDPAQGFEQRTPNCERGYIGKWNIRDGSLWLVGIYGWRDGKYAGLVDLFGSHDEVSADWYSGPLIVEPASSEIPDGAKPKITTLLVEAGRIGETI